MLSVLFLYNIYALRHGHIDVTSIKEVLEIAVSHGDDEECLGQEEEDLA